MANPDPARITDEMWKLWTDRPNQSWKLGGIYADKKGYHNTVNKNLSTWPDHYSVQLPLDLVSKNRDKARAIDLTMTESEMIKWTKRMQKSALDPNDNRLAAVKEFYGTLDGKTVYGLTKDSETGKWRRSSADLTHLWHGHVSIFTAFVAAWNKLSPILSVWRGESFVDWQVIDMGLPKLGDSGEEVKQWQYTHNYVRKTVDPPSPELNADGVFGPTSLAAFQDFWKKTGGKGTPPKMINGWLAMRYTRALAISTLPKIPEPQVVSSDEVKEYVNQWLTTNVPNALEITGSLSGKVQIK